MSGSVSRCGAGETGSVRTWFGSPPYKIEMLKQDNSNGHSGSPRDRANNETRDAEGRTARKRGDNHRASASDMGCLSMFMFASYIDLFFFMVDPPLCHMNAIRQVFHKVGDRETVREKN